MVGGSDLLGSRSPVMASKHLLSIGETEFLAGPGSLMRHNFSAMSTCLASDYGSRD